MNQYCVLGIILNIYRKNLMSSVDLRNKITNSGFGNLLNICLELHMSNTGSSDVIGFTKKIFLVTILEQALEEWKEGPTSSKPFDDAVKNLIEITIKEYKDSVYFYNMDVTV